MTNSKEFAYIRVSTAEQSTGSQVNDITKAYPQAEQIVEHGVSGTIPAKDRPQLSRLLDKLRKGDTLVVWWIDRLGRDYTDSKATIEHLLNEGVTIKTVNQGLTFVRTGDAMKDMTTDIQLTVFAGMAAAERENRLASAEAGRQALRQDPKQWAEKFKGGKENVERNQTILELLLEGKSIRKIADEVGCNPSTVQRQKAKHKQALADAGL